MKKLLLYGLYLLVVCPGFRAPAQTVLTDEFDFWEDQLTHNFTTSGITYQGAYTCSNDKTLRCGDCGNGTGAASVVMKVNAGCDTVLLTFLLGWSGGNTVVTAEGVWLGTISAPSCTWDTLMLVNASAMTADSAVTVVIRDTILGCSGDIQTARLRAYSSPAVPVGFNDVFSDAPAYIRVFPNPAPGGEFFALMEWHEDCTITILDMRGRKAYSQTVNQSRNRTGRTLRIKSGLPAGVYWVQFSTRQSFDTKKLMIF